MFSLLQSLLLILLLLKLFLILLISLLSLFSMFLLRSVMLLFFTAKKLLLSVANVFPAEVAATDSTTAKTISNTSNIAAFAIYDVSAAISPLSVPATDSTAAKTISNTANIAAFAIFDVSAAISVATAFSPLRNRY